MLTVDLNKVCNNWKKCRDITGRPPAVVVKSNAYGLGVLQIAKALARKGCNKFYVMMTDEGVALRNVVGDAEIFLLGGFRRVQDFENIIKYNLIPILSSAKQIDLWNKCRGAGRSGSRKCGLHLFTGMRRVSIEESDAKHALDLFGDDIVNVMSHIACADTGPDFESNKHQLAEFSRLAEMFPNAEKSLAASGYRTLGQEYWFDHVRLGYGLYHDAIKWDIEIVQVQKVFAGDTVGYGNEFVFKHDGMMATADLGYASGLMRSAAKGNMHGFIGDYPVPLVGRVSMDLATFDVSNVPRKILDRAAHIELIGPHQTLDEFAMGTGTIGYEVLTNHALQYGDIEYKI